VIVVADASPLRYLILIEHVHVLPALYGHVIVPPAVLEELSKERTPEAVRTWLANRPNGCKFRRHRRRYRDFDLCSVMASAKPSRLLWNCERTRC
jgi:hypothetical protein